MKYPRPEPEVSMSKSVRRHGMMAVMLGTALSIAPSASAATVAQDSAVRDLSRYCVACWRNAGVPVDRWSDCTQETLCELLERVPLEEWSTVLTGSEEKRRELIRVIDLVKKRFQREKKWAPLDDEHARNPKGDGDAGHDREAIRLRRQLAADRPPASDPGTLGRGLRRPRDRVGAEDADVPRQRREVQGDPQAARSLRGSGLKTKGTLATESTETSESRGERVKPVV